MTRSSRGYKKGDTVPVPPAPRSESEVMSGWEAKMATPLASIVCHTYNHVNFIQDALNGFLMQETEFPFEIIVHDDASGDGTRVVLESYKARFPNIVRLILQTDNQYQQGHRPLRVTFPLARGKYIATCEGDDYWIDPRKLSKQVCFLDEEKEYAIVYTNSISFAGTSVLGKDFGGAKRDLTPDELKRAPNIPTATACFKNVIDAPPELAVIKAVDRFIWSRLGYQGRGKYMGDILPSFYRVHEGGVFSLRDEKDNRAMMVESYFGMYAYYKRIGETEMASYFFRQFAIQVLVSLQVSPRLIGPMRFATKPAKRLKSLLK